MFDSSKISRTTLKTIGRGFRQVHGKAMTNADLQSLQLREAKAYLAAGKTKTAHTSKIALIVACSVLASVGLAFLIPSEAPASKVINSAAGSEPATSDNIADDETIEPTSLAETDSRQVQSAQTEAPPELESASVPEPVPAPALTPPAVSRPASNNCDPNYSGGCVPNVAYDLDCPDIGFTVQVVGSDPHRFDRDKDGIGCE